jgi:hypothetical protein
MCSSRQCPKMRCLMFHQMPRQLASLPADRLHQALPSQATTRCRGPLAAAIRFNQRPVRHGADHFSASKLLSDKHDAACYRRIFKAAKRTWSSLHHISRPIPNDLRKQARQKHRQKIFRRSHDFLSSWGAWVKSGTKTNYDQVRLNLVAFFGYEKPLRGITLDDAESFRNWLKLEEKLSENTMRRRCGRARQFFTAAKRSKLVEENPF